MASTRDIRRRIKSVKSTSQITKAMELVAASKMKRAQDQATAGRSYADLMNNVLVNLKEQCDEDLHPLLQERSQGRELILVVTTDKGLCGALNTNLLRQIQEQAPADASFITVGSKGSRALARLKRDLVADFHIHDPVPFAESKQVSKFLVDEFLKDGSPYATVKVAFTNFINTIQQEPMLETLLPIRPIDLGKAKGFEGMGKGTTPAEASGPSHAGYIFEPTPEVVLDLIVPQYINYQVYQMLLESRASEHSSRMVAMKSATDNAKQLIKDLTLEYNKKRQEAITNELLEITTAMKALE